MKYQAVYECIANGSKHLSEFYFESDTPPMDNDSNIIEIAIKDSVKFSKSGMAGIKIISISPASENL